MNNYEYLKDIKEQYGPLLQAIEKSGILQERERIEEMRRIVKPAVTQFQVSGIDAATLQTIKSLNLQGVKALAEQYGLSREVSLAPVYATKTGAKPRLRNMNKACKQSYPLALDSKQAQILIAILPSLAAVVDGDTAIKINLLVIVLGLLVLYCGEPSDKDE